MRAEAILQDDGGRWLVLGLGCERGASTLELVDLAVSVAADLGPVAIVATLDARADEPAIHAVARHFSAPLVTFPAARLESETPRLANPSAIVFSHTGCHGVAEAAALAQAGEGGRLIVGKTKSAHATVAIAEFFRVVGGVSCAFDSASSHSDSSRELA